MRREQCPNCLKGAAVEINRKITDVGLKRTFECQYCGNDWTVVF